ncbi:MAG: radical SAM protein [archaeon]
MVEEKRVIQNYAKWLGKRPFEPLEIEIKPTNNCNLNCMSCRVMGNLEYDPNEEIGHRAYTDSLKELGTSGLKVHITGGGEPFAYPGITGLVSALAQSGISSSVTTNGTLITGEQIDIMVSHRWRHIFFSLDAPDAETHDKLRGKKGTFERVVSTIEKINEKKKALKSDLPSIELGLVLSEYNADAIGDYIDMGIRLHVKNITLQPLRVEVRDNFGLTLSDETRKRFMGRLAGLRMKCDEHNIISNLGHFDDMLIGKTRGITKVIESYTRDKLPIHCFHPWFFMSVHPNGDIFPCSFKLDEPFGNIGRNSLKATWESAPFELFRKRFHEGGLPPFCNMCCGTNITVMKDIREQYEN